MDIFQDYAYYYQALYKDKDYRGEAVKIDGLLKHYSDTKIKTILNAGCGGGIMILSFPEWDIVLQVLTRVLG